MKTILNDLQIDQIVNCLFANNYKEMMSYLVMTDHNFSVSTKPLDESEIEMWEIILSNKKSIIKAFRKKHPKNDKRLKVIFEMVDEEQATDFNGGAHYTDIYTYDERYDYIVEHRANILNNR